MSLCLVKGKIDNIIVIGKSGVGKQARVDVLCDEFGLTQLSTGNIFREFISKAKQQKHSHRSSSEEAELGRKLTKSVERGEFVTDELTCDLFGNKFGQMNYKGTVLDGFPRSCYQARFLIDLCSKKGAALNVALIVDGEDKELIQRTIGRRICPKCGKVYHLKYKPPFKGLFCTHCNNNSALVIQRSDDKEPLIRSRLQEYHSKTEDAIKLLQHSGIPIRTVSGTLKEYNEKAIRDSVIKALNC